MKSKDHASFLLYVCTHMTKQTTTDENNIILSIASVNQETLSFINNTVFRKQLYQILIMSMHSQGL